jgi:hypothetical protein
VLALPSEAVAVVDQQVELEVVKQMNCNLLELVAGSRKE